MVEKKSEEEPGGKVEHSLRFTRPDGCTHRYNIFVDENFTVIVTMQEVTEALITVGVVDEVACLSIETQDVWDHPVEAGPEYITALSEQRIEVVAIVLKAALLTFDAETHFRFLDINVKLFQQADKVGIGSVIQYDKAGVYF